MSANWRTRQCKNQFRVNIVVCGISPVAVMYLKCLGVLWETFCSLAEQCVSCCSCYRRKPPPLLSDLNLYKTRSSVYGQTLTFTVLLPPLDNFTANLLLLSDHQNCAECQPLSLSRAQPHTWCDVEYLEYSASRPENTGSRWIRHFPPVLQILLSCWHNAVGMATVCTQDTDSPVSVFF